MNKSLFILGVSTLSMLLLSGCSLKSTNYTNTFDAGEVNYASLDSMNKGEACIKHFLGLPIATDSSVEKAAENGGISVVKHVDKEYVTVLPLFTAECTVVYGN